MKNSITNLVCVLGFSVWAISLSAQKQRIDSLVIRNGSQGVGRVLTSDANGNANWTVANSDSTSVINGLSMTGKQVRLGGAIDRPTVLSSITATNNISLTGTGANMFNVNGANFSVDGANSRVGIGTISPSKRLSITNDGGGNGAADDISLFSYNSAGSSPSIEFFSSRGSLATPSNLQFGDDVGQIWFGGRANGSNRNYELSAITSKYRGSGTNDLSNLSFFTSNSLRMLIDESGNVAMGDDSATHRLSVYHTSGRPTYTPSTSIFAARFTGDANAQSGSIALENYNNGSSSSLLSFVKARGSSASPSGLLSGDELFRITSRGHDGSSIVPDNARVSAVTTEDWSTSSRGTAIRFFTTQNGSTSSVNSMSIGQNGFVGIGQTSPSYRLHTRSDNRGGGGTDDIVIESFNSDGSSDPGFAMASARGTAASPANLQFGDLIGVISMGGYYNGTMNPFTLSRIRSYYRGSGTTAESSMEFQTSNTTRMVINRVGFVSIGDDSCTHRLGVFNSGGLPSFTPSSSTFTARFTGDAGAQSGSISLENYNDGASSALVSFIKSRGSASSPSGLLSGDELFRIGARGHDGSTFSPENIRITAVTTQDWTSTARGSKMAFSTTANGSATPRVVATLGQDGSFNVGTSGDSAGIVDIIANNRSNSSVYLRIFSNTSDARFVISKARGTESSPSNVAFGNLLGAIGFTGHVGGSKAADNAMSQIASDYRGNGTTTLSNLRFWTSGSEQMRIDEVGQVGIGTSSPNTILHALTTSTSGYAATFENNANSDQTDGIIIQCSGVNTTDLGHRFISFRTGSSPSEVANISNNASGVIALKATSDARLKENVKPTMYGLKDLLKVQVKDYNYKSVDPKNRATGFIAQELYEVYPQVVSVGGEDPKKDPWTVDYAGISPLLVKAIQDQQVIIESQKKEIDEIKRQLQSLMSRLEEGKK